MTHTQHEFSTPRAARLLFLGSCLLASACLRAGFDSFGADASEPPRDVDASVDARVLDGGAPGDRGDAQDHSPAPDAASLLDASTDASADAAADASSDASTDAGPEDAGARSDLASPGDQSVSEDAMLPDRVVSDLGTADTMRSDAASRDATATSPYLIVNTLDDQLDGPGDMVLVAQAGPELSLREAIVLCNNGFEPPLIYFDGSVFSEVAGGVILLDVGLEGGSLPVVSAPGAQIIATENTVTVRGPALQRPLLVVQAPQVLISGVRLISNRQVLLADGANALNLQGVYLQSEASGSIPIARVMGSALVQISGSMVASNDVLDFVIENSEEIFLPYGSFIRVQLRITASPFSAFQSLSLSESDRGQPAIQIADSMECDFSDISLANMRGTGIQIATSNEVSFTRILGASCTPESPCEQSPLIDVQSGNEVEAHQIEAISWSNQLFRLAAGTNTGATPPVITGASGQLISGTSALGDNGTIDVYEVSERRQTYLGQAVVRQNTWSWALSDPAGPQRFFSATATTWLGSTSEASAVFRPDPPSNCGSASVLARHDFEPGDRTTWSLTNVDFRQGFAAYQGLGYVETIDDTSGSLSLIQPLDLSTASTAELRVMIQRSACCSSSLPPKAEVLTRRSVTASWQHLPLVVSSGDAWQQRQVDLGAFVGAPTLYLGLALDDGPAGYLRVDQVEICGY